MNTLDPSDRSEGDDFLAEVDAEVSTAPALPPPIPITLSTGSVVMIQPPAGWSPPPPRTVDEEFRLLSDLDRAFEKADREATRTEAREAKRRAADAPPRTFDEVEVEAEFRTASVASRMGGLAERRAVAARRGCPMNVSYLDDAIGALLPSDVALIGAYSGAGKTQLSMGIAARAARDGREVLMLAIEADDDEIENRLVFREAQRLGMNSGYGPMTYRDWYQDLVPWAAHYTAQAEATVEGLYANLHVHYGRVTPESLRRTLLREKGRSDLIVVDHLHYVESDDVNELRAQRDMMRMLRDASTEVQIPIIAVAHLRKKSLQGKYTAIVPDLDDFMGSSEIPKIATTAIMIARAPRIDTDPAHELPTYMSIPKDRRNGANGYVARIAYDLRRGDYAPTYTLGRIVDHEWAPVSGADLPHWAKCASNPRLTDSEISAAVKKS